MKRCIKPLIIVAPDKFKGTLSSCEAAKIIAETIGKQFRDAEIIKVEMADGGEGTAPILAGKDARVKRFALPTNGRKMSVPIYEQSGWAHVDSADIIGMKLISDAGYNPMNASSFDVGWLINCLLGEYAGVCVCVGGTATVDGGAGMMQALGVKFCYDDGFQVPDRINPHDLMKLGHCDMRGMDKVMERIRDRVRFVVDVDVPLLPLSGCGLSSLSFAPQKGLRVSELPNLNIALKNLVRSVELTGKCSSRCQLKYIPGGAGGGLASIPGMYGCEISLGAELLAGRVVDLFDSNRPTLLITGEGSLDAQSFGGKLVGSLWRKAHAAGVPVLAICGIVKTDELDSIVHEGLSAIPTVSAPSTQLRITAEQAKANLQAAVSKSLPLISSLLCSAPPPKCP